MEIQVLKLVIGEPEINRLAAKAPESGAPVRDLTVRFTPDGVVVTGKYQALVGMAFETRWQLSIQAGKVRALLADVKVGFFPAGGIKNIMLEAMCATADVGDALVADGDAVLFDLDKLLALQGFPARTNLTAVRCEMGKVTIEANMPDKVP